MSGDGGVDIDLYADVEQDFPQEDFSNENNDLYDDVITASTSKDEEKEPSKAAVKKEEQERGDSQGSSSSSRPEGRRLVCSPPVNLLLHLVGQILSLKFCSGGSCMWAT